MEYAFRWGLARGRLIRQLLTESLVISVLAALAGVVIARVTLDIGLQVFYATAAPEFTKLVRLHSLDPDYRVFLFALCAAVVAALGAALIPARAGHTPQPDLGTSGRIWHGIPRVSST